MPTIQWFPGHMAKARREMAEALQRVDAVLELVDARLPVASRNPLLDDLIRAKPRVVVMTRVDLADPHQTAAWMERFRGEGAATVAVDARSGSGLQRLVPTLETATAAKREKDARRGIRPRPTRTMVVGIPNVGKSSLINRLAGRVATKTGDKPGVTKAQQWIRLGAVELLDTPGVLWPKFDDEHSAYVLAVSGAIKSEILDRMDVCSYFLVWCAHHYPHLLRAKYGLEQFPPGPWTGSAEAYAQTEPVLTWVARRRGLLGPGGQPSLERTADAILRDVQNGALGRLTFEWATAETDNRPEDCHRV